MFSSRHMVTNDSAGGWDIVVVNARGERIGIVAGKIKELHIEYSDSFKTIEGILSWEAQIHVIIQS